MPARSPFNLRKKFIFAQHGWKIYSVDAFAIRNLAQPDEEFTNFATKADFPKLIPQGEVWVARKNFELEGLFLIANAMTQLKQLEQGIDDDSAYQAGVEIERDLRTKINGLKFRGSRPQKSIPAELYVEHYLTIPDARTPIEVWQVDGNLVRSLYRTDYTEGGHGHVYPWCPKQQIWIEKDLDKRELPFIVTHEYLELRLMRDKRLPYERAHAIAACLEFELRKGRGLTKLLSPGRKRITKRELPHLAHDEIFAAVLDRYVKPHRHAAATTRS